MTESRTEPGLLEAMWAYRWAITAFVLIAGIAAYALSTTQPVSYAATARLVLDDPRDPGVLGTAEANRFLDPERYFPQQAERLSTPAVLSAAADILGGGITPTQLERSIETSTNVSLNTILVTATAPVPEQAARFANAVAEAYQQDRVRERQDDAGRAIAAIQEQIIALRDEADAAEAAAAADPTDAVAASRARILTERIIALEAQAGDVAAQAAFRDSGVESVIPADVPQTPAAPLPLRNAAIAAFLAGVVAVLLAYRRAGSDERVRSAGDVASILGAPLLGEIPTLRRSDMVNGLFLTNRSVIEALRFVLASVEYQLDEENASVLITSANSGDGKSMLALQLSLAARRDGRDVILVDGDPHARGLTQVLRSETSAGLANILEGSASVEDVLRRYRVEDDVVLPVITAGDHTAEAPLARRNRVLTDTLNELRSRSELVVLDTPPLLAVAETTTMANHVDGIVLVIPAGTSRRQLRKLEERLAFTTSPVLGFVYNWASGSAPAYGYGERVQEGGRLSWLPGRRSAAPQSRPAPADDALTSTDTRR